MVKRQAILTIRGLISQGTQIVITGTTYGVLTTRRQDIHGSGVGNSMDNHLHLAESEATMEGIRGIMSKHTCPLYNQLKRDPWNKVDSTKMRLKN